MKAAGAALPLGLPGVLDGPAPRAVDLRPIGATRAIVRGRPGQRRRVIASVLALAAGVVRVGRLLSAGRSIVAGIPVSVVVLRTAGGTASAVEDSVDLLMRLDTTGGNTIAASVRATVGLAIEVVITSATAGTPASAIVGGGTITALPATTVLGIRVVVVT
jgi:hypothetical protein